LLNRFEIFGTQRHRESGENKRFHHETNEGNEGNEKILKSKTTL